MKDNFELVKTIGVISEAVEDSGEFTLYPKGFSMLPTIRQNRDYVTLIKAFGLKKGDIVLYKRKSGEFVLHRILKINKSGILLCGDNQSVIESGITENDILFLVKSYGNSKAETRRGSLKFWIDWKFARLYQCIKATYHTLKIAFCRNIK